MAMQRFVMAALRKNALIEETADRIPGTTKIRTFCVNADLFSGESDLDKLIEAAKLYERI